MSQALHDIFGMLNKFYFSGKQTLLFNLLYNEIQKTANSYLQPGQSHVDQDMFFNQFTVVWEDLIKKRRYEEAKEIWNIALRLAFEWENNNKPHMIHKGTPYYFLGVSEILNNELENGFLSMHQALEEDKKTLRSQTPSTPAYFFVTLDYTKQAQFFRFKVEEIARYLSDRIDEYRRTRSGGLNISDFKTKFLECTDLSEEVFLFVYLLFELKRLVLETDDRLKQNVFSSLLHTKILFDVCLVIEKAIEYKNPKSSVRGARLYFRDEVKFLSRKASLSLGKSTIGQLNADFGTNFEKTLSDILISKYSLKRSKIAKDLAVAYGIRNFAAHKLENQPVIYQNMKELSQRLLNALFFSIEKLF